MCKNKKMHSHGEHHEHNEGHAHEGCCGNKQTDAHENAEGHSHEHGHEHGQCHSHSHHGEHDHGDEHQHDHEHGHEHAHSHTHEQQPAGDLEGKDIEILGVLLDHWVSHNQDHAMEYNLWVEKMNRLGKNEVAEDIIEAMALMSEADKHLIAAKKDLLSE